LRLIFVALFLCLTLHSVGKSPRPQDLARPLLQESPELTKLRQSALDHYKNHRFRLAAGDFEAGFRLAQAEGQPGAAIRFLNNLAGSRMQLFDFPGAMTAYLEARNMAELAQIRDILPPLNANIALLYAQMGQWEQSIEIATQALADADAQGPFRAAIRQVLADCLARTGRLDQAIPQYRAAAAEADRAADSIQTAHALDHLGYWLLEGGRTAEAEAHLEEAFRLRKLLAAQDAYLSEPKIGRLRVKQGRPAEALMWFNRSIDAHRGDPRRFPLYRIHAERAQARTALGDIDGALADYRAALKMTRDQRLEVVPASGMQATYEQVMHDLRSSFIALAAEKAIRTGDRTLTLEALAAAEESRRASFRAATDFRPALPASYWEKLAGLRQAQAAAVAGQPQAASQLLRAEIELTDIEAQAGLQAEFSIAVADPVPALRKALARLGPDEAAISFHLGEPYSYRWDATVNTLTVKRLPGKTHLLRQLLAIRADNLTTVDYPQIFGELSPAVATKQEWSIVLDDRLFELPLAAAPDPGGEGLLVQRHTVRLLPAAFGLGSTTATPAGGFVGIGDPAYNSGDPRLKGAPPSTLELPRLVGSGAEIDRCATASGRPAVLLSGVDASPERLREAMGNSPGIIHFATHFVSPSERPVRTFIALSRDTSASAPALFGAEQIRTLKLPGSLVVLSGCRSGSGEAIPGAGLMGLTRGWLTAGASAVAAAYWPTPDDQGDMLSRFHRHYSREIAKRQPYAAARALRSAQLEMMAMPDWRREPRYWAAFFVLSRG